MLVAVTACVPDEQAAQIRKWKISNDCAFEVAVSLGDPSEVGIEMDMPNQFVLPGEPASFQGPYYSRSRPEVWAWRQSSTDRPIGAEGRPIFKIVVDGYGEELTLSGAACELMESG